jgi:Ca2+-binding EF-hand superfamily protein
MKNKQLDVEAFRKQITQTFIFYDPKKKGYLTLKELRSLTDHIRGSIGLLKADDAIFNQIVTILDDDESGTIELEELLDNMRKIMPIISQCGEEMEWIIKKAFGDFDIDGSGYLERGELRLLFNLTSDRLGVERPDDWQVDYIVSLIDSDGNAKVSIEEMVENYRVVAQELFKNKKVRRNRSKDFFNEVANPDLLREKDPYIEKLGNMAKEYIKNAKELTSPEGSEEGTDVGEKLDKAGRFARDTARKLIPLPNMLNSNRNIVEIESDEEKPLPEAMTGSHHSENDDDGDRSLDSDRHDPYQKLL